jgi:hypothetical protein
VGLLGNFRADLVFVMVKQLLAVRVANHLFGLKQPPLDLRTFEIQAFLDHFRNQLDVLGL